MSPRINWKFLWFRLDVVGLFWQVCVLNIGGRVKALIYLPHSCLAMGGNGKDGWVTCFFIWELLPSLRKTLPKRLMYGFLSLSSLTQNPVAKSASEVHRCSFIVVIDNLLPEKVGSLCNSSLFLQHWVPALTLSKYFISAIWIGNLNVILIIVFVFLSNLTLVEQIFYYMAYIWVSYKNQNQTKILDWRIS